MYQATQPSVAFWHSPEQCAAWLRTPDFRAITCQNGSRCRYGVRVVDVVKCSIDTPKLEWSEKVVVCTFAKALRISMGLNHC
jgi:hypothetical protein